jgi:hypothetical protein
MQMLPYLERDLQVPGLLVLPVVLGSAYLLIAEYAQREE